jgi:CheY-like chemotaxis protein
VVLVQTSQTQAGIVRRFLQQLNITAVHQVGSGSEAIDAAKRENADAILCSMHLADMTGLGLADLLQEDIECARVGLVLATSETDITTTESLQSLSERVAVVFKPYDLKRLAHSLAKAMV